MKFSYDRSELTPIAKGEEGCFLLSNGLGGYCSLTHAGSAARGDHALLMASFAPPGKRMHLITNLNEILTINGSSYMLSSQRYDYGRCDNDRTELLSSFEYDGYPTWHYAVKGISVTKSICMAHGFNTVSVKYTIDAPSGTECALKVVPLYRMTPKNEQFKDICDTSSIHLYTNGEIKPKLPSKTPMLYFSQDERDGRIASGKCFTDKIVTFAPGQKECEVTFSTEEFGDDNPSGFEDILSAHHAHEEALFERAGFTGEITKELLRASDAFVVKRENVKGKTVIAGFPFFEDWGRDTFISLPGLTLASKRYEDCRQILRTFAKYEKNGLLPNLFPEGGEDAMYNSVDAPLLFINTVWRCVVESKDPEFAKEMLPVMLNIEKAYEKGTDHHIKMDTDGLIAAGADKEQLTWMDVCIDGFLPTPRHGKPIEINAYWYSALCILHELTKDPHFLELSEKVKASCLDKFVNEDKNCLKDVLNGTSEEDQIRCNQIWALTQSFNMLSPEIENGISEVIRNELFTTAGLRTLSPSDPNFHEVYIGDMYLRDLAYHQGTVWAFPLGAYYRAEIRHISSMSEGVERTARFNELQNNMKEIAHWLREGCTGQLAEIYDGLEPTVSRGCFAQAWSIGEILYAFYEFKKLFNKEL